MYTGFIAENWYVLATKKDPFTAEFLKQIPRLIFNKVTRGIVQKPGGVTAQS